MYLSLFKFSACHFSLTWVFGFSCFRGKIPLCGPCSILIWQSSLIKCSMRKKKAVSLQLTSEVFSAFCFSCLYHPHHFHNFIMASKIWLLKLIWPFQVQLFLSIGQGLFQALPPTRSYTRKAGCSNPLWRMTDQMDPCLVESVAKEEWLDLQWELWSVVT